MKPLTDTLLFEVLDRMPVARLALRDFDDAPMALPIVVARAANALWSPIDGKPKQSGANLGRLARIERAPRVMLLFDHYGDDWSGLWWIRLRCVATIAREDHADWAAGIAALTAKYPQYQQTAMFKDEPIMVRFQWAGVSWWSSSPDAISRWVSSRRSGEPNALPGSEEEQ